MNWLVAWSYSLVPDDLAVLCGRSGSGSGALLTSVLCAAADAGWSSSAQSGISVTVGQLMLINVCALENLS